MNLVLGAAKWTYVTNPAGQSADAEVAADDSTIAIMAIDGPCPHRPNLFVMDQSPTARVIPLHVPAEVREAEYYKAVLDEQWARRAGEHVQ